MCHSLALLPMPPWRYPLSNKIMTPHPHLQHMLFCSHPCVCSWCRCNVKHLGSWVVFFKNIFFWPFNKLYWIETVKIVRKVEVKTCSKGHTRTWAGHFQPCGIVSPAQPTELNQHPKGTIFKRQIISNATFQTTEQFVSKMCL